MSPRSPKRRDFAVTQAGYFTVLKSTGGFSATLPPGSRYLNDPSRRPVPAPTPDQAAPDHDGSQETAISFQLVDPPAQDRHSTRLILIVLAATAIMLAVLWWMIPASPWKV